MGHTVDVVCREAHPDRPAIIGRLSLINEWWHLLLVRPTNETRAAIGETMTETVAGEPVDLYEEMHGTPVVREDKAVSLKIRLRCNLCQFDYQRRYEFLAPSFDAMRIAGVTSVDLRALARTLG